MNNNNPMKSIGLYFLVFALIIIGVIATKNVDLTSNSDAEYTYSQLITQIESDNVASVSIQRDADVNDTGIAKVTGKDGKVHTVQLTSVSQFMTSINNAITNNDIIVKTVPPSKTGNMLSIISIVVCGILVLLLIFFIFQQMQGGGGNKVMNFGKSRAKLNTDDKNKITFKEVAGLDEEKEEVEEIVEFLKHPKKYIDIGARIPKGILLVGQPGTGKTLLAKAIAGEAGVPFFSISGSDFVEMFVGVGASRVRDLFEQAKKNTPCLVFIDEIDAVGRRRGAGLGGGHDEREQTLNQLLVEMDGFGINEGVIIIAATNRPDILDPALLRPGRFDRQVVVGAPDVKGREDILKVHARNKKFAPEVDLHEVAQTTPGFTGADLENLLNESALLAARENKLAIDMTDIRKALIKVAMGTEKKSKIITEKERKITAYHEAGHALLFELLPDLSPVHIVSIIPVGRAGGYTMPVPEEKTYRFKGAMLQDIVATYGGRVAEEIIFGDITTGASGDIEHATKLARLMVTKFGMSDSLGPILFGEDDQQEVFLGRDIGHARNYGENVATDIDAEINRIITESYNKAKEILTENIDALHRVAEVLLEKEKISGEEFRLALYNTVTTQDNIETE